MVQLGTELDNLSDSFDNETFQQANEVLFEFTTSIEIISGFGVKKISNITDN